MAKEQKQPKKKTPVIRNIMADGTILTPEQLKGYEVPYNETTAPVYRIIAELMAESQNRQMPQ